ncbi:hypothetical protein [Marinobacter mangrovi]|uniref:hypothetical protein n=1 Tax=Marinobacter mangrovi TaxID=2803918 RepID=UPI00193178F9|nr:hypothetical protein [Marinobacter mangrovi]
MKQHAFPFVLMATLSTNLASATLSEYRFYGTDYRLNSGREHFAAYVLKSDPCITVDVIKGSKKRYCELGSSGINLERDAPSVYATNITVDVSGVRFIAAAPWNEQECSIDVYNEEITCAATGKN